MKICNCRLTAICLMIVGLLASGTMAAAPPVAVPHSLPGESAAGQTLHTAWIKAGYRFTPEVRTAYLKFAKAQAKLELAAGNHLLPADFLAWVDSDPVVEATVYGIKDKPANVLRILRSLELDLGTDVVRKQYTQSALAMAVSNADHKDFTALGINLVERPLLKLVIPPNPLKPVNTQDPNRTLDVNDHIINFLNSEPLEYEVKIPPAKKGDPVTMEKRTRPMVGADVLMSKNLQAKFNRYMKAHGQTVEVNCLPPNPSLYGQMGPTVRASEMFREAYLAKGLLPERDATPKLAETCAFLIGNDQYKFPPEANRVWPLFPLKGPWPTLTFLALSRDPLRECEDIWQTFVETGRPLKKGPAYVGSIAQKPDLLRARSVAPLDFGYGSVQMMCKDGGVCGVQSAVSVRSQQALGRPAATTAEVGHCGTTGWTYNAKDNTYTCGNNTQSPWGWVFSNPTRSTSGDRYLKSNAYGINYGLQAYLDSFMVSRLYCLISAVDRQAHGLTLLDSGLEINPYNILLSDAVSDFAPLAQLHMLQKMEARLAAITKPGCPPHTLNLKPNLFVALIKKPVPTDPAEVRELYTFMQPEKGVHPIALARYQAAAEGLPATLAKVEAALKAHLAAPRDPKNCKIMADNLFAAASQIADKTEQKAWAQQRLKEITGHEAYLKGRILIDPTAQVAAKLAGQRLPAQAVLFQPPLDQFTASWQATTEGKYNARLCGQLVGQIRGIIPQITDPVQKKQWRKQLLDIIGEHSTHQTFKPMIEKAGWRVTAASRQARGLAAARAIDGHPKTLWQTDNSPTDQAGLPQEFTVDMGEVKILGGFTYLPREKIDAGMVDDCAFYTSLDGKQWTLSAEKKFDDLLAKSTGQAEQRVSFAATQARYFKLVAKHVAKDNFAAVAEVGVVEVDGTSASLTRAEAPRN